MENECKWKGDEDGVYTTDCGEVFQFEAEGPEENSFKFCCFCGEKIVVAEC